MIGKFSNKEQKGTLTIQQEEKDDTSEMMLKFNDLTESLTYSGLQADPTFKNYGKLLNLIEFEMKNVILF